jgi:DNA polymerase-1
MNSRPDLVLVDGSSYLYRAFHALPPFSNSRCEPTGAVFGVLNMLAKFLKDYDPERIAVVFDAPGKTFRDELFAEYKAHRPPMPDDLRSQIEPLFEAVRGMGLPILRETGVEADDVIGTLACAAARENLSVLISTGDKDMAQLVSPQITLINTMSGTVLDRDGVKTKFDVFPEQIIDYLALVGDSSDNIPGIDKVGPKTAAKWLGKYSTLDALVADAANVEGKVGENLRAGLATLELARKLATIRTDVTLPVTLQELKRNPPDVDALRALYSRLELRSLLKQLDGSAASGGPAPTAPDAQATSGQPAIVGAPAAVGLSDGAQIIAAAPRLYETITTDAQLDAWLKKLEGAELFAFDTETTSLEYMKAEIVGVSFAVSPGVAAYLPLRHDYAGAPDQLDRDAALAKLKPLLESEKHAKVGHHLKYDAHVLANHGIRLAGMRYDSMLESYVWNSVAIRHDMDSAAERYLGIRTIHYEDVAGKGAKQISFSQVPVDKAAEYSSEDSDVTLRLHQVLWPQIASVPLLKTLYEECEQPLVSVL